MKMNLRVISNDDKSTEVVASAADLVAFEAEFSRSVAKFQDEFRYTDICWLAWHSLNRRKKTSKDFSDWINDIDSVELGSETNEISPLEPNQQPG